MYFISLFVLLLFAPFLFFFISVEILIIIIEDVVEFISNLFEK